MSKHVHVMPSDGGWTVRVEGSLRPSRTFGTKQEAMSAGRELAKRNRSEHIVHGRDGRIRQQDSYGRDPFPPRAG